MPSGPLAKKYWKNDTQTKKGRVREIRDKYEKFYLNQSYKEQLIINDYWFLKLDNAVLKREEEVVENIEEILGEYERRGKGHFKDITEENLIKIRMVIRKILDSLKTKT